MRQVVLHTDVSSLIIKQQLPASLLRELLGAQTGITPLHRRDRPNLGRDLRARRTPRQARPQNDTWIAAFCLVYGLPLATLNVKDYKDFAEHEGLILVGV